MSSMFDWKLVTGTLWTQLWIHHTTNFEAGRKITLGETQSHDEQDVCWERCLRLKFEHEIPLLTADYIGMFFLFLVHGRECAVKVP